MTIKYRAKVSATVELDAMIIEYPNGEKEIEEVLEVTEVNEFENIRPL